MSGSEDEADSPLYSWTFATDERGDLRTNEANRMATAHGFNCLVQGSKVAIGTGRGEDPLDEDFGLDPFEATKSVRHLKREIRRTLIYDDKRHSRVDAVEEIDVTVDANRDAHVVAHVRYESGDANTIDFSLMGVM